MTSYFEQLQYSIYSRTSCVAVKQKKRRGEKHQATITKNNNNNKNNDMKNKQTISIRP